MNFSEKELEDWCYKNPMSLGIERWVGRQLVIPSGILDLVGIADESCPGNLTLFELKAVPLKSSAVLQVCRYAADLERLSGVDEVIKICIGPGGVSDELLFAADAVGVTLKNLEPSFFISGGWGFNEEAKTEARSAIDKLERENWWFRYLAVRSMTVRAIYSAEKNYAATESLLLDIANDYEIDIEYLLRHRNKATMEAKSA